MGQGATTKMDAQSIGPPFDLGIHRLGQYKAYTSRRRKNNERNSMTVPVFG